MSDCHRPCFSMAGFSGVPAIFHAAIAPIFMSARFRVFKFLVSVVSFPSPLFSSAALCKSSHPTPGQQPYPTTPLLATFPSLTGVHCNLKLGFCHIIESNLSACKPTSDDTLQVIRDQVVVDWEWIVF